MTTLRKVVRWMIVLVLLLGAAGAGVGWWMYARSDELLRSAILNKFAEIAPDWNVTLDRANFDFYGRVRVFGLTLTPRGQSAAVLSVAETAIVVDREQLTRDQQVHIERIHLVEPVIRLGRNRFGEWSWQQLPPIQLGHNALPEWDIKHGTVVLSLEQPHGAITEVRLEEIELTLVPAAARQFLVQGSVQIERAGTLQLDGQWSLDRPPWFVNGAMKGVALGPDLVELLAECSPDLQQQLVRAGHWMRQQLLAIGPERTPPPISLASQVSTQPLVQDLTYQTASQATSLIPDLGVVGTVDVNFRLEQSSADAPPQHRVLVTIHGGEITNPLLPFPLYGVRGRIYGDPRQIVVRQLQAENGTTRVTLDGWSLPDGAGHYDVTVTDLAIDERLRGRLPASWLDPFDDLHLSGRCSATLKFDTDGQSPWICEADLTARGCSVAHSRFPYPVREVHGTLKQRGSLIEINLQGRAEERPVTLTGTVRNPGPAAEAVFAISVDHLPLDATLLSACPPAVQKTLASLNMKGTVHCRARLVRPAGLHQKFEPRLALQLVDCSLAYEHFPYRLNRLTGFIALDGTTWTFSELQAQHDDAVLTGHGQFRSDPAPGELELTVTAQGAQFDRHLQMALPEGLQQVWAELSPSGQFNVETQLRWVPDQPVEVTLPKIELIDAGLMLRSFPYGLEKVRAELAYADRQVVIRSFLGRHDDMQIRGTGFGEFPPEGEWRVRLDQVHVDDLNPSPVLRRALPEPLKTVVETLNPTGRISINGAVEFRNTTQARAPRALWNLQFVLSGTTLTAGIEARDVHGRVRLEGLWDGQETRLQGELDLDSVNLLEPNFQLTQVRGPIQISDGRLTIGAFSPTSPTEPQVRPATLNQHVTGRVIGGLLTLDAVVDLVADPVYQLKLTLSNGSLERLAQRYLRAGGNLQGVMNGWMSLQGRGLSRERMVGTGQLQISPAALYELPILVQIFKVLRFDPALSGAMKTAFHYANLSFEVANGRFNFDSIDLVGDAISLRGRGYVRFDGTVLLDFYSMLPRNQLPIPILHEIVGQMSQGWYRVEVRGNVSDPDVKAKPVPQLDDALKQFLSAFEMRPLRPPAFPPQTTRPAGR